MITIDSHSIMDIIRKECPVSIKGSLDRITILPPTSYDKLLGVVRFETSEGDQTVDAHWFVTVMPEATYLKIRYPVAGNTTCIKL